MLRPWKQVITTFCIGSILYTSLLQAGVELKEGLPNPNDIQVVPMDPSPEPNQIRLRIQYPSDQEVETKLPVHMETRIDWFPLGYDTELPRRKEIYNDPKGQAIHVIIDNLPYFEINEALFDALDDHDEFFDQIAEFHIPYKLSPGMHIIRAFPCRSFGESLKQPKAFVSRTIYYQEKTPTLNVNLNEPYLTYNEPQGEYPDEKQPILLDFYVTNCALSKDGYKVRLTIDGTNQRFLYDWVPYYLYGLSPGTHSIRLELINPQNIQVPGIFNDISKTFTIKN